MRVVVEGVSGPGKGRSFTLRSGEMCLIGRTDWSDVQIGGDEQMSAKHFSVESSADGIRLIDQNSTNGTQVNGKFIKESYLQDGDQIVAGTTTFRVRIDESSAAAPPPPLNQGPASFGPSPHSAPLSLGGGPVAKGPFGEPMTVGESERPAGGTPFGSMQFDPDQIFDGPPSKATSEAQTSSGGSPSTPSSTPWEAPSGPGMAKGPGIAKGPGGGAPAGGPGEESPFGFPPASPAKPGSKEAESPFVIDDDSPFSGQSAPASSNPPPMKSDEPAVGSPFDESPFGAPGGSDAPPRPSSASSSAFPPVTAEPSGGFRPGSPAPPMPPAASPANTPPTKTPQTNKPANADLVAEAVEPNENDSQKPSVQVASPSPLASATPPAGKADESKTSSPPPVYDFSHSVKRASQEVLQYTVIPELDGAVRGVHSNYGEAEVEFSPSMILSILGRQLPSLSMVHYAKGDAEYPEELTEAMPLLYWLPDESARKFGPVLVPPLEHYDHFSLFDQLWDKNSVAAFFTRDIERATNHLVRLVREDPLRKGDDQQDGMFAYFYPIVFDSLMRSQPDEVLEKIFGDVIEACLIESPSEPGCWQLFCTPEFFTTFQQLGFREIKPAPKDA